MNSSSDADIPRRQRHGGACLRRAMFITRNASIQHPARPATTQLACVERCSLRVAAVRRTPRRVRRKHRPTRTSRAVAGSVRRATRSGCEHGSTVASTVVAPDVGRTDEMNVSDHWVAANDLAMQFRLDRRLQCIRWFRNSLSHSSTMLRARRYRAHQGRTVTC